MWGQRGINVVTTFSYTGTRVIILKPYKNSIISQIKISVMCIIIYHELVCEITHLK